MTDIDPNAPASPPPPITTTAPDTAALDQIAALQARLAKIESDEKNRPASTKEQLQEHLAELIGVKGSALDAKVATRAIADQADPMIVELTQKLRRSDIRAAAASTGFGDVDLVIDMLMGRDGEPETLVADLAKRAPQLLSKPAASSAPIGAGDGSAPTGPKDARQRLIDEIEASKGT